MKTYGLTGWLCLLLTLLVALSGSALTACSTNGGGSGKTDATGSQTTASAAHETAESTATTDDWSAIRPNAPSGELRLWWSRRSNLNPLLDSSESGLAIHRLIFQGLFAVDANQQVQPVLADQLTISDDGMQATIRLKPGLVFHHGQAVQAGDVAACLNFIKANALSSAYASSLSSVISAAAMDEQTVQLVLSQPDPWLAWHLTFPVIPAARLAAGAFELVPGTGLFQMTAYQPGTGLMLSRVSAAEDPSALTTIRILEYASLSEAMKAFENDAIDLVSLPTEDFERYRMRNSLRVEQYIADHCLLVAYNTQKRNPLSDIGRLLFLKQLLQPGRLSLDGLSGWGECTAIPLPATSWLLAGSSFDQQPLINQLGTPVWDPATRELVLLLPSSVSFTQTAADIIVRRLAAAGVKCRTTALPDAEYQNALRQGRYDLALLEAVLPEEPDATWLYRDDRAAGFALLGELPAGSLADYDIWRQRLLQATAAQTSNYENDTFSVILNETAVRSAWSVLLIRSAAVLYGDRVIGQCRPDRYNPYKGIEELWIWSGHSS